MTVKTTLTLSVATLVLLLLGSSATTSVILQRHQQQRARDHGPGPLHLGDRRGRRRPGARVGQGPPGAGPSTGDDPWDGASSGGPVLVS